MQASADPEGEALETLSYLVYLASHDHTHGLWAIAASLSSLAVARVRFKVHRLLQYEPSQQIYISTSHAVQSYLDLFTSQL